MMKIGITGGIGSGKSTVCEIFHLLGVPVFHADIEARLLQNNDAQVRDKLIGIFGENIYSLTGELNRKRLAGLIFNDQQLLQKVNLIVHPVVRQCFMDWANENTNSLYVLYEAAILLESGYANDFDLNVLVVADEMARIERVISRDHTNETQVRERIKNQMTDEQKIKLVDFVIENNDRQLLIPQIIEIDKAIRLKMTE